MFFCIYIINILLADAIEIGSNTTPITLHRAATLASNVTEVLLFCSCQNASSCQTKRCKCFKNNAKCTDFCHRSVNLECGNLASTTERTKRVFISRVPLQQLSAAKDNTLPTDPQEAKSDTVSDSSQRKRRASRLSTSE